MRGRLLRLPRPVEGMRAADLLDLLYSIMVDDLCGALITRYEAREEVDQALYDLFGASESELRRTWGRDQYSTERLSQATDMFKAEGG